MNIQKYIKKKLLILVPINEHDQKRLLSLIERDLLDAQCAEISIDRRYATAYGAALNLSTLALRQRSYKISCAFGSHQLTFKATKCLLKPEERPALTYFDLCRRKRNKIDYQAVNSITPEQLNELIAKVLDYKLLVETRFEINAEMPKETVPHEKISDCA